MDPRMGGPQRRSLNVARLLANRGIETAFLIPEGDDSFEAAAAEDGFDTYRLSLPRIRPPSNVLANGTFIATFLPTTRKISGMLREQAIDVVHANMSINFQTALAASQTDTPLVWHFNDTLVPTPVRQVSAAAGAHWADEIVVAADAVHDYYFESSVPSRTIYPPVDTGTFNPASVVVDEEGLRADLNLPLEMPIVGSVGNLSPVKGHEFLLRATAKLREYGRDVAVPIVGAKIDSQQDHLERLRTLRDDLGLNDRVEFVGFRSDVPELLSVFDLFALPSRAEACPIAVLEAMAMGCPVVATGVGGVPEQIPDDDHGWVIPPEDPDALAAAIDEALGAPEERRRRRRNAYQRVESVFSLQACVDRHESLYQSLTEQ